MRKVTEDKNTIRAGVIKCVGVDYKIHMCEPHSKITSCGIKVRYKYVRNSDFECLMTCPNCGTF